MKKQERDYIFPFKKLYYALYHEDADMCYRAKEVIAAHGVLNPIKNVAAQTKIKKEIAIAKLENREKELFQSWEKEILDSEKLSDSPT